jgi:hypothetical protein
MQQKNDDLDLFWSWKQDHRLLLKAKFAYNMKHLLLVI